VLFSTWGAFRDKLRCHPIAVFRTCAPMVRATENAHLRHNYGRTMTRPARRLAFELSIMADFFHRRLSPRATLAGSIYPAATIPASSSVVNFPAKKQRKHSADYFDPALYKNTFFCLDGPDGDQASLRGNRLRYPFQIPLALNVPARLRSR